MESTEEDIQPNQARRRLATQADNDEGFWTRQRLSAVVLLVGTALLFYACYLIVSPFLPSLAWALALAIIAEPAHRWIARHVKKPGIAAALSVALVAIILVAPLVLVGQLMVGKAAEAVKFIESGEAQKVIEQTTKTNPHLEQVWLWIDSQGSPGAALGQVTGVVSKGLKRAVGGSVWGTMIFLVAFLMLFYFWRDRSLFTGYIRHFLPLSDSEATNVFRRLKDTIHASIFGTLVVAAVQGALGGLMFWWLGLPAPLLWGVAMGLLAIIPVLGAFVIWLPAAVVLAAEGQWGKATILTVWGTVVVGLIDNLLYPILVGKRLRLHTVPVFIGIVGGLMLFGASGLVLGPVVVALTDAVLNIWRCRTAHGQTADAPPA